jgi:hypothetical protein
MWFGVKKEVPIHGPHNGIKTKSINIQRKNNNYIEYSYTIRYSSI